jgi:hypothetical protein
LQNLPLLGGAVTSLIVLGCSKLKSAVKSTIKRSSFSFPLPLRFTLHVCERFQQRLGMCFKNIKPALRLIVANSRDTRQPNTQGRSGWKYSYRGVTVVVSDDLEAVITVYVHDEVALDKWLYEAEILKRITK